MPDVDTLVTDQVLIALRRIIRATDLHSRTLLRKFGITGPQLIVLRTIEQRGELSGSAVARELSVSPPTAADIIRRLKSKGFIERRQNSFDKREVLISLTGPGRRILDQAPPPLQESFTRELSALPDWEQTGVLSALQRVVAMMEAETLEASPVLATGQITGAAPADAQAGPAESAPAATGA